MRAVAVIVAVFSFLLPVVPPARADVVWVDSAAKIRWRVDLERPVPVSEAGVPIAVERWFPQLPDEELTGELRGDVLIVAFWASWCDPCREELPALAALRHAFGEERVDVLAVNLREGPAVARGYLESIGVDLPVAPSTPEAERAFKIRSVPVVVVADSRRRVRGRWDGFHESTIDEIADRVRELLSDGTEAKVELATVFAGADLLEPAWMRDGNGTVDRVAAFAGGEPGFVALAGRTLYEYAPSGLITRFRKVAFAPSRLLAIDDELVGFRPGGSRVVVFDRQFETRREIALDVPVIDAAIAPDTGRLVVASLDGIWELDIAAGSVERLVPAEKVMQLAPLIGAGARLAARTHEGELLWFDERLRLREGPELEAPALAADPQGAGLAVLDRPAPTAFAQLLPGGGRQLAVVASGHLRLFDLDGGTERFIAEWPGISTIFAFDIDGDGRDELVVGAGDRLTVLESTIKEN